MFAYCNNNPANFQDSTGSKMVYMRADAPAPAGFPSPSAVSQTTNSGGSSGSAARKVEAFVTNTDEQKVLNAEYFSFYKGIPVVRTNGDRSGYFGIIFLTRETNNRSNPEDMIRHEYGHALQMQRLGIWRYATNIFLPSWLEWGSNLNYYSREVEITADILGGVISRTHTLEDIDAGFEYLDRSDKFGIIAWATIN